MLKIAALPVPGLATLLAKVTILGYPKARSFVAGVNSLSSFDECVLGLAPSFWAIEVSEDTANHPAIPWGSSQKMPPPKRPLPRQPGEVGWGAPLQLFESADPSSRKASKNITSTS